MNQQKNNPELVTHLVLCNLRSTKLGAYEMFLAELSKQLAPDTLVVALVGICNEEVSDLFRRANVKVELISQWQKDGKPQPWRMVPGSLKLIKKYNPISVGVHFGNELPVIVLKILATLHGYHPIFIWHQHQQVIDPNGLKSKINKLRLLSWFVDCFVAVYEGGRCSLEKRGVAPHKITVTHNGMIDYRVPGDYAREVYRELDLELGTTLVVTVGWLVKRKRIDWLLSVWNNVTKNLPSKNIKLLIIGDGPERSKLEQLVEEFGIAESVVFTGERNDVRAMLAVADIYVHASMAETCTYTITESMCAAIPAVVSNAGAANEQILDGVSGFVVEPTDRDKFARCLAELVKSSELRERMGRAARKRWEENYNLNQTILPLLDLYKEIRDGSRRQ